MSLLFGALEENLKAGQQLGVSGDYTPMSFISTSPQPRLIYNLKRLVLDASQLVTAPPAVDAGTNWPPRRSAVMLVCEFGLVGGVERVFRGSALSPRVQRTASWLGVPRGGATA